MFGDLIPGIKGYKEMLVAFKDTASVYGSGLIEVFATPALIALMENTAHSSVQPYICSEFTTVGSEVAIKHFRPTPVGEKVVCESILTEIQGRKLYFEVKASDSKGLIGSGLHVRYVVNTEKFLGQI